MRVVRNVTERTVCEYLLKSSGAPNLAHLSDEEFEKEMKVFGESIPDNPAVVWLGYSPKHRRPQVKWNLVAEIDVRNVFSKGLNPAWLARLQAVGGNLYRFIIECDDVYGREHRLEVPSEDLSLIICVCHPDNQSHIELVDGSHRLAGMVRTNHVEVVNSYVAYY